MVVAGNKNVALSSDHHAALPGRRGGDAGDGVGGGSRYDRLSHPEASLTPVPPH